MCSTPWGLVGDYKIFIFGWTASLTHLSNHFTSLYWQYTTNGRDGATNFSRPINTGQGWNRLAITNLKQTFKSASPIIRQVNHWKTKTNLLKINAKYDLTRLNITITSATCFPILNHTQNVHLFMLWTTWRYTMFIGFKCI